MMKTRWLAALAVASTCATGAFACSSDDSPRPAATDGGARGGGTLAPNPSTPSGFALKQFTIPNDPGPGAILFAASGEVLALTGYPFPPVNAGDPAFVDGWDVKFTRLLVTVDKITLSENPDFMPGDQSQTGPLVAEVDGPWAIDLAHSDPSYLPGKGGPGEEAVQIAALATQNKKSGAPSFATDGTRYAFGFDAIAATGSAQNVNLDVAALEDYQQMIAGGCAVLYVGTATFKGDASCSSDPEYTDWPKAVNFRLCFKSPTTYLNCQNPDNDPAKALDNEEHERGVAFLSSRSVIGQVTFHTDHPFWDSVLHDSPAHFDQFAARVVTQVPSSDGGAEGGATEGGVPTVTLEMTKGVDYSQVTDALGNALKWRYCIEPPTDVHPKFTEAMAFDPQNVPHCTGGSSGNGLCDYYDFSTYDQSTQGHLNSDGLCYVKRNYPSPP